MHPTAQSRLTATAGGGWQQWPPPQRSRSMYAIACLCCSHAPHNSLQHRLAAGCGGRRDPATQPARNPSKATGHRSRGRRACAAGAAGVGGSPAAALRLAGRAATASAPPPAAPAPTRSLPLPAPIAACARRRHDGHRRASGPAAALLQAAGKCTEPRAAHPGPGPRPAVCCSSRDCRSACTGSKRTGAVSLASLWVSLLYMPAVHASCACQCCLGKRRPPPLMLKVHAGLPIHCLRAHTRTMPLRAPTQAHADPGPGADIMGK